MTNIFLVFACAVVSLVACTPSTISPVADPEQILVTETVRTVPIPSPQIPTSTATSLPLPTMTPRPTKTPEMVVEILPTIEVTLPPDACPPGQPENSILYSSNVEDYRGKQYSELPAGWEERGGYVVENDQDRRYVLSRVEQQGSLMLWLEKVICTHYSINHSSPHLEITDVLFLPLDEDIGDGPRLILSTCWKVADYPADSLIDEKERWVDTIIAVGYFEDYRDAPTEILYAWELNLEAGRFEELLTETVACTGILGL